VSALRCDWIGPRVLGRGLIDRRVRATLTTTAAGAGPDRCRCCAVWRTTRCPGCSSSTRAPMVVPTALRRIRAWWAVRTPTPGRGAGTRRRATSLSDLGPDKPAPRTLA